MEAEYARELVTMIEKDKNLEKEIRENPVKAIAKIAKSKSPLETDKWIYRIVVLALGSTLLLAVSGGICLAAKAITPIPDILVAIGSAAVGALAGLLVPTPSSK